jgi:predicted type IV restriction endonuclease
MDFTDHLKTLTDRANKLTNTLQTEEATKQALILPFLQALGYDVFNTNEVQPEFTSDIGLKKGEKVDFAILMQGKPVILIECKHVTDKLDKADSQLLRYFHVSAAKFGILTNGLDYKFFTDLVDANKMDDKPFLQVNILNLREQDIIELKKFHKSVFNIDQIFSTASELKYLNEVKSILNAEMESPSESFVKYFIGEVYAGRATVNVIEQFKTVVKKALNQFTSEIVSNKLKSVLDNEKEKEKIEAEKDADITTIITTEEELQGFYIVKGIIRQKIDSSRVFYRDVQNWFSIIIDDNNRKPICRLYFNAAKKFIGIFDEKKAETKTEIKSLDDIFRYSDQLLKVADFYKEHKE